MASTTNSGSSLWVLIGLGITGVLLLLRRTKSSSPSPSSSSSSPSSTSVKDKFRAFISSLDLRPRGCPAVPLQPLAGLTFAIADIFDVEGSVTGFGSRMWAETHEPATNTAPVVTSLVEAGARCIGKTYIDELGYSTNGQNRNFGAPINPVSGSHVPGGCCSGSAAAVASELVDFALGTDAGGGVRVPAAYCGILGYRPSHGLVACNGMVPVSQSLDAIGWFARNPNVLRDIGQVLLQQPFSVVERPGRILIAEDCFDLIASSDDRRRNLSVIVNTLEKNFQSSKLIRLKVGEYFASRLPSLKMSRVCFRVDGESGKAQRGISVLRSLKDAFQLLQGHEFKVNHEEWIHSVKLLSGNQTSQQVKKALETGVEHVAEAMKLRNEARIAMNELLLNDGILVIPTVHSPPPKLRTKDVMLQELQEQMMCLLSIASMSGGCQVSIPMKWCDELPSSVSLIAKHGADHFLLDFMTMLFPVLQSEVKASRRINTMKSETRQQKPDTAEVAKEKGNEAFIKKDYRSAIRYYSEAIRCDEGNATVYSNRAAAYLAVRSFHQAEADCTTAIDLDKKNVKAFLRRATARELLGCYKESDEDFRYALALEPSNKTAANGIKRLKRLIL